MNALDKAFIKAFAKNRVLGKTEAEIAKPHIELPPAPSEDELPSLVLHDLREHGKRLRVDQPQDELALDAHMVLSLVEQVQSYEPEQVESQTQPSVLFEDRLVGLDEPVVEPAAPETDTDSDETVSPTADSQNDVEDNESNVTDRMDAQADRDVQALDSPSIEQQVWEFCQSVTIAVTEQVDRPDLLTVQDGQLRVSNELSSPEFSSQIEIQWPEIDWDSLARAAEDGPQQSAPEDTSREAEPITPVAEVEPEGSFLEAEQTVAEQDAVTSDAAGRWQESAPEETYTHVSNVEVTLFDPALLDITRESIAQPQPFEQAPTAPLHEASEAVLELNEVEASATCEEIAAESPAFAPAWEVDAFRWPALCQQLDEHTMGRLTQSGEELCLATREGLRVVAVTSSQREEGRSTLALSLARTAARAGARVALVDGDAGNPELARRLGMEAPCDWREVLGRGEPLSEAAVASLEDGVTLFPRSYPADTPHGALDEPLTQTLRHLHEQFDLVVVDLPPVDAETPWLGRGAVCPIDMALVVRNVQITNQQQSLATAAALREVGVLAVGLIENFRQDGVTA